MRTVGRFTSHLRWELVLQVRQGFLLAGCVVAAMWIALGARWLDDGYVAWAPAFTLGNLGITSFFFVGGLVLFEKSEGSLQALWLTPLRPHEYLASKAMSLGLFAVIETCVILAACFGLKLSWVAICLSMLVMSTIFTLVGILMVLRYRGISEFILPASLVLMVLQLPMVETLGLWSSPILWAIPTQPPLKVLEWAMVSETVGPGGLSLGILGSAFWIGLLGWWCRGALRRFAAGTAARASKMRGAA